MRLNESILRIEMAKKRSSTEYELSPREIKFVSFYIETGNIAEAVELANYNTTSPLAYGRKLLSKTKVQKEMQRQLTSFKNEHTASAQEIMIFLTQVMRGEITDQFGLDATLKDRMDAAKELAKRQIDMQAIADKAQASEVHITLDWSQDKNEPEMKQVFEEPDLLED